MRRTTRMLALGAALAALVTLVLGGCGVTTSGTGIGTETGGTTTPLASPTASPAASPAASATPTGVTIVRGSVTVTLDKAQFIPGEAIVVSINNGLPQSIFVADHQTRCSLVTLELQTGSGWQAMAPCLMMTPTGTIEIKAGTTNIQRLLAPSQPPEWPAGTYRVRLPYAFQRFGSPKIIYSTTFAVL